MAEETIGKGYIQILPSIKDFKPQLEKEIQTDLSSAGTSAGNSFGDSLKSALKAAGIAYAVKEVVEGVAQVVQQSISNYAEFETATAKVATIMDTSVMSIEEMQTGIMDLSNQFGISTSELSDTVYNAISATGDTANALNIAENAAKLASAGFTDTGSALSVLTTAMNAYGLSADEASAISDSLIQVQNLGVTTVAELSTVMGKAIASASAYGVDLGNVEAAYVSMTKAGISTAESTTYMSSMMKELGDSGSNVSAILQEQTGKSFSDLMSDGYSLADVLGILYESCGEDSTALMNLWSSAESGKASNAIISQGLEEFNNNLEAITTSAGTTQTAFETMDETLESKVTKLSTAWTNLLTGMASGQDVTALTENLVTQFESVADAVLPLVENIADSLPQVFTTIGEKLPELVGTLLPSLVSSAVSLVTSLVSNLPSVISPLITALPTIVESLLDGLVECLPQLLTGLGSLIGDMIAALPEMLSTIVTSLPDILLGIAEGIGGGIRNIIEAVTGDSSWSDTLAGIEERVGQLTNQNESLASSLQKINESYSGAMEASEADAYVAEALTEKLYELIDASDGSAASQREIQTVVDMLNESVPGLGLEYDAQTNQLNMNTQAIGAHIEMMKLEAQQEAAKSLYTDALEAKYAAQSVVNQAEERALEIANQYGITEAALNEILADGEVTYSEKNRLVNEFNLTNAEAVAVQKELNGVIEEQKSAYENLEAAEKSVEAADKILDEVIAEVTDAMIEQSAAAAESVTANSDAAEELDGLAESSSSAAEVISESTEEISTDFSTTAEEVSENLGEVQTALDELDPQPAVDKMTVAGEEMTDATDNSTEIGANTAEGMNTMISEIEGKMTSLGTAFSAIVMKASEKLGAQSTFQTNLKAYGGKIPTLLANGANESQYMLDSQITSLINSVDSGASTLQTLMYNDGYYAGQGLYNGLGSWQSSLYNLAWSIANSINSAARAALQIRSPSHIMEEVGQFTGEGLAVGIEDSEEDVMEAMTGLTEGMIGAVNGVVDVANSSAASVLGSPVNVEGMVTQSVNGTISAQVSQTDNSNIMNMMISIYNAVAQLANMKMVIDTGEFVGALAPAFDQAMATMATMEARK